MAATVSDPTVVAYGGFESWTWTVTETSVGTSSEWKILLPDRLVGVPKTMTLFDARKTAGSGLTIQPKVGTSTNPTSGSAGYLDQIATAAAAVRGFENVRIEASADAIFGRSTPDSASDNAVTTEVTIVRGHLP